MMGMQVEMREAGGRNKGTQVENLPIGVVGMMNQKCGEIEKRKCVHFQKYSFYTLV